MYSPAYAVEKNPDKIYDIIDRFPLATIVYQEEGRLESFNLPLIREGHKLIGHLARKNPAARLLDKEDVLFIFNGPDSYIRPSWYESDEDLPTWNYISVQIRGKVCFREDESFLQMALKKLNQAYDPDYDLNKAISLHQDLLSQIVGFELEITETFAKFKLGQRKSPEEKMNIIKHLKESSGLGKEELLAEEIQNTVLK